MAYAGEVAALVAALCWAVGSVFWTRARRQVGSVLLNRLRLLAALLLLAGLVAVCGGPWPWRLGSGPLLLLGLSGVLGLSLGDVAYFHALPILGPRLTMLTHGLWPGLAALLGWCLLGETLSLLSLSGMALTLGCTAWVAAERAAGGNQASSAGEGWAALRLRGLCFAALAVLCQAGGFVLAKMGTMDPPVGALPATLARMGVAVAFSWGAAAFQGGVAESVRALRDRPRVAWDVLGGALVGTTLGIWLGLFASQHTSVGIAGTLMATGPLWMIPASWLAFGDRPTPRSVVGTLGAVGGVALLILGR